jgi:hypothetical protein
MEVKKIIFILAVLLFCTGCFTPIGKIPKEDFGWQEKIIEADYQEVYRRVLNGFRTCKPGIAEGNLYTDIKEGHFDVYLVGFLGTKHPGALGMIDIKADEKGNTIIKVGVQKMYDHAGYYRKIWLSFAEKKEVVCDF